MRYFHPARSRHLFFPLIILGFVISCQSNGSPIFPTIQSSTATAGHPNARAMWGYYNCAADMNEGTISVIPSRTADLHINAVKPLNKNLGVGFQIDPSSNPPAGYFVVNVSLTHPFANNPQLAGFDVRGILLCNGSQNANGLKIPGTGDARLTNADGWSRWWNPTEFTTPGLLGYVPGLYNIQAPSGAPSATLNPYKAFGDALWATADADFMTTLALNEPNARAIFRSGKTNSRQYKIQFPVNGGPKVYFDYAVDASWAQPNPNPPVQLPKDFPIWANGMEPFLLKASVVSSTLAASPYGYAGGGELEVSIEVWDWQGWNAGTYSGQIGNVKLYAPGVIFNPASVLQADGLHNTILTVKASGIPTVTGAVPVAIEICAPGTAWKQGAANAPAGEIAAYTMVTVDIGLMECGVDENVECTDAVPVGLISTLDGAVCMPDDPTDYYVFTTPSGKVMSGTITLDNFNYSDNDMILYDGCPGEVLQIASKPWSEIETLQIENFEAGMYYIAVVPGETAGTDVQPYRLNVNLAEAGSECTKDDNNEYTQAWNIGLTDSKIDSVCAGGDLRDWYKFIVPQDKVVGGTVYLDNHDAGDIQIRVYDVYPGVPSYSSSNPGTMDEMVSIDGLGPGAHYIELFAMGAAPKGDRGYTLQTTLVAANFNCTSGDGNDSSLTADPVGYADVINGTVCFPADPDWFLLIIPANKAVTGTIKLSGGNVVDNDLYFYEDPTGAPLKYSAAAGINDEQIDVGQLDAGNYYIKAIAHPNIGNGDQPYTLTLNLKEQQVGDYDFLIHAHIVRQDNGQNPATTEAKVQADAAWASEFYSTYGGSFTVSQISYINKSSLLAATSSEMSQCHLIYRDKSGPINVYYVNSFPDMSSAAAYCRMDCRYTYQTHNFTYVAMSDFAENMVLAHELGHATGIFHDVYLLDSGFSNCAQINAYYCPYGGNNGAFCQPIDAKYGNLMWFGVQGWNDPEDYWLSNKNWQIPALPIESQAENWIYFHANYPNNF